MFGGNFEWDNTAQLAEEGMSLNEKRKTITTNIITSILSLLTSSFLIFMTFTIKASYPDISHFFFNILLSVGISGVLLSLILVYWAYQHKIIQNGDEQLDNHNPLDTLAFVLTSLQIIVNLALILYMFIENRIIKDYYIVEHGLEGMDQFWKNFGYLLYFGSLALIVQEICFFYSAYSLYITSLTLFDAKSLIHSFNLVYTLFALATMWAVVHCQNLYDVQSIIKDTIASSTNLSLLYYTCFAALFVSMLTFTINIKKSKINYIFLGAVLLVYVTIVTGINKEVLQSARNIQRSYIENCNEKNLIQNASEEYLKSQKCEKYRKTPLKNLKGEPVLKDGKPVITYDLSCPPDFATLVWEQQGNSNQQACLNMNCCLVLADSISIWWYRAGFLSFGVVVSGFCVAMSSFFLSQREKGGAPINLFGLHFTSFVILLLLVMFGFHYVQFRYLYPVPQIGKQQVAWSADSRTKNNNAFFFQEKFENQAENVDSFLLKEDNEKNFSAQQYTQCEPFNSFLLTPLQVLCSENQESECEIKEKSRITIVSEAGYFKYDQKYLNSEFLQFFRSGYQNQLLIDNLDSHSAYLSVQGSLKSLNSFIQDDLYYCGANPLNTPLFYIESQPLLQEQQGNASHKKSGNKDHKSRKLATVENNSENITFSHSHKTKKDDDFNDRKAHIPNKSLKSNEKHEVLLKNDKHDFTYQSPDLNENYKQCLRNLQKQFDNYTSTCFDKINSGNYETMKGSFGTVQGYETIVNDEKQKVIGKVLDFENCISEKSLIKVPISNLQVRISFQVKGNYLQFQEVSTNANGEFALEVPYYYNRAEFIGKIEIAASESYLGYTLYQILGNGQDIHLDSIYLVPKIGHNQKTADAKLCSEQKQHSNLNKNESKVTTNHKESEQEKKQIQRKKTKLEMCENRLTELQNSQKTCSIKFFKLSQQDKQNQKQNLQNSLENAQTKNDSTNNNQNTKSTQQQQQQQNQGLQPNSQQIRAEKIKNLNKFAFFELQMNIYDIITKHPLQTDLKVSLFKNHHSCVEEPNNTDLMREMYIEKSEIKDMDLVFYNLLSGSYTLLARASGYHSYCEHVYIVSESQIALLPLVPRKSKVSVAFEHNNHQLSATLGIQTQKFDGSDPCLVYSYNSECENIRLSNVENVGALGQLISIDELKEQKYLFFLQKIAQTQEEKIIMENLTSGLPVSLQDLKETVKNQQFTHGNLRLKLYVQEREFQVLETYIPDLSEDTLYDPVLTWLSLCIDGSKGDVSAVTPYHFWSRATSSSNSSNKDNQENWWQQTVSPSVVSPGSEICAIFYEKILNL